MPDDPPNSHSADAADLRSSGPLAGERVCFTGTLASMTHQEAYRLVEERGGTASPSISRQTTMLVVGEEGWPLENDGQLSRKLEQAHELWQHGVPIQFLQESEWLYLIGLEDRRRESHRLYTPAMLGQMLDVSPAEIRRWERAGWIRAVRHIKRLPYFDFQEVAGARRIAQLLSAGVSPKQIQDGLTRISRVLRGVDRPLVQLEIIAHGSRWLYRDPAGLVESETGQRCFDFEPPDDPNGEAGEPVVSLSIADHLRSREGPAARLSADDWLAEACQLIDEGRLADAVDAYRLALMERPGDPLLNFQLAETLYRLNRPEAAAERLYCAVESDPEYIEAWTQLGCTLTELDRPEEALAAFDLALEAHPDFSDAHYHKADLLDQLGREVEAAPHWRAYLAHIDRGPWAERARQRLTELEKRGI